MYPEVDMAAIRRRNADVLKRALVVYFFVGVAVATLIPESFLDSRHGVAASLRLFDAMVPGIARLAAISPFPNLMRLFLIVMWTLMPFAAYRVAREWHWNPRTFLLKKADQWFLVCMIWCIATLAFAFLFAFVEVNPSSLETRGRGTALVWFLTQYRASMGLVGSLYFCMIAMTLGLAIRLLYLVASGRGAASITDAS
jgi:hypothetical protein